MSDADVRALFDTAVYLSILYGAWRLVFWMNERD